jgi:hypothetical protein
MQNKQNNIDELFSDKLKNFETTPPLSVWEKLEKNLDRKRKTRVWIWIYGTGIAASLLIAFSTGWYLSSRRPASLQENNRLANIEPSRTKTSVINENEAIEENQAMPTKSKVEHSGIIKPIAERNNASGLKLNQLAEAGKVPVQVQTQSRHTIVAQKLTKRVVMANNSKPFAVSLCLIQQKNDLLTDEDHEIIAANLKELNLNPSQKESGIKRWSVGVQLSPNQQFDDLLASSGDYSGEPSSAPESVLHNISSEYDLNIAGGLNVQYQATQKLSFQSGINYNTISQNNSGIPIAFAGHNWISSRKDYAYQENVYADNKASESNSQANFNTNMGIANLSLPLGTDVIEPDRTEPGYSEWTQNFQYAQSTGYIEIPFIARYQILGDKFGLHLLGGINTNVLVSNQAFLMNKQEVLAKGKIEDLNTLTFSSSMGLGINYTLWEKLQFSLEPIFKMMLNDMNNNASFVVKPYTIGIYTGVSYHF